MTKLRPDRCQCSASSQGTTGEGNSGVVDASDTRVYHRCQDSPMGPGKVPSNIGITIIKEGGDQVAATGTKSKVSQAEGNSIKKAVGNKKDE